MESFAGYTVKWTKQTYRKEQYGTYYLLHKKEGEIRKHVLVC